GRGGPLGGIPTQSAETLGRLIDAGAEEPADAGDADPRPAAGPLDSAIAAAQALGRDNSQYGRDLMGDAARYAEMVAGLARTLEFDVVHAHDWLTYPAGLAVRAVSGKPMVAHVHATEFDRSGNNINQAVYDIERAGITAADRIIVVSKLTRELALSRYGGDEARTDVCYNGVEGNGHQPRDGSKIESNDKIVLFL
ncbi:MAG: glycosyltransferase family 4 protein, partial [Planctomycetota bacterium]